MLHFISVTNFITENLLFFSNFSPISPTTLPSGDYQFFSLCLWLCVCFVCSFVCFQPRHRILTTFHSSMHHCDPTKNARRFPFKIQAICDRLSPPPPQPVHTKLPSIPKPLQYFLTILPNFLLYLPFNLLYTQLIFLSVNQITSLMCPNFVPFHSEKVIHII